MKPHFPASILGPGNFADHYIFNCAEKMPPHTLVHFGDRIGAVEYKARRETAPEGIGDFVRRPSDEIRGLPQFPPELSILVFHAISSHRKEICGASERAMKASLKIFRRVQREDWRVAGRTTSSAHSQERGGP
jgi:hypothetical protein